MDWLQSKTEGNHNVCLHISFLVMVQSRAAWADETQVCWPKQSSALWKGTWTQQGTEMSPGVQEKLHGDGARKTCLASELNNWASKQKLKGVSSPNFSSFHKFPFLGGITKQTNNNTENKQKNNLTTGNVAP